MITLAMLRRSSAFFILLLSGILFLGAILVGTQGYAAEDENRQTEIVVGFTQYEWWLTRWSNNTAACAVYTDHEGLPTPNEIEEYCGTALYNQWKATKPCTSAASGGDTSGCTGLYLHAIAATPQERTIIVDLPEPEVFITLSGCEPYPLENLCKYIPSIELRAYEPLPNEFVTGINVAVDGESTSCSSDICEIPLRATSPQGIEIEFWADSSFGDSSPHYTAQVRVVDTGLKSDPAQIGWYVDILSSQWRGSEPVASCAAAWDAFPPVGGVPPWLDDPDQAELLQTTQPYYYLAGQLINSGIVDALDCPSGGLEENGWANTCGLEKARPVVDEWQNQFDQEILDAAQKTRVPSQLLKLIFAQESQFWPGAAMDAKIQEFGLGRLTELGADTVLLWNYAFYSQFCPLVLAESTCEYGYSYLDDADQAMLRGALTISVNADCPTCPSGIDLSGIDFSIRLFAQTLLANCEQTGYLVNKVSRSSPGVASSYEDLWRFTLVNYHAGPGCLEEALNTTRTKREAYTWNNVSKYMAPGCVTAVNYVNEIVKMGDVFIQPTPSPTPTAALTAAPTIVVITPVAPAPTQGSYPPPPTSAPTPLPTVNPYPTIPANPTTYP